MPRGGHKVKPAKAPPADGSSSSRGSGFSLLATKKTPSNIVGSSNNSATSLHSPNPSGARQNLSNTSLPSLNLPGGDTANLAPTQPASVQISPRRSNEFMGSQLEGLDPPADTPQIRVQLPEDDIVNSTPNGQPQINEHEDGRAGQQDEAERLVRPTSSRVSSSQSIGEDEKFDAVLDTFPELSTEESQSSGSSIYSRDSAVYSSASSIYSSASSIYSSASSMYSFDDRKSEEVDGYAELCIKEAESVMLETRLPGGSAYQQVARGASVRRFEAQQKSSLAKKAALYKNSRLPPQLSPFSTSLPTWALVCRAAQASQDCYDSRASTRRGTYTAADASKDIKAMIVDDQFIDGSRVIIVSIRGTQCQCLADWAVNKAATPAKPVGFLDDEENACHAGFLQVTRAMIGGIAVQLQQQHPASSEKPSLLFTGHSAGGAVAAMLYSHMLSTTVQSELTALAGLFTRIDCMTFGAPPLSLTPLQKKGNGPGVFLAFANEGDPILRLSNAAYLKSLGKLLAASPPSSATVASAPPPVKVVRSSQRSAVRRREAPAVSTAPWEELPLWPTPPAPLSNAGDVILLRDKQSGSAVGMRVTAEDMSDVIFGDLAQHPMEVYKRRVNELAFAAITGTELS